jgi:hypothetical protein
VLTSYILISIDGPKYGHAYIDTVIAGEEVLCMLLRNSIGVMMEYVCYCWAWCLGMGWGRVRKKGGYRKEFRGLEIGLKTANSKR